MKLPLERKNTIYTIVASRSHSSQETIDFIEKIKKDKGNIRLLNKGSSLKLCLVAEGKVDIYPRFARTMEWDTAAGDAILRAAGGMTYTSDDTVFKYGKKFYKYGAFIAKAQP